MSAEQGRLLIVEDEEAFARFVSTVATGIGYAARAVTHSRDVEFQLSEWKPTVLFLDIFMPDRDGLELLGLLQRHAYDGRIVMMSGADSLYLNMAAASAKVRGLRLAGVLAKPCRKREIEDLLIPPSARALADSSMKGTKSIAGSKTPDCGHPALASDIASRLK